MNLGSDDVLPRSMTAAEAERKKKRLSIIFKSISNNIADFLQDTFFYHTIDKMLWCYSSLTLSLSLPSAAWSYLLTQSVF